MDLRLKAPKLDVNVIQITNSIKSKSDGADTSSRFLIGYGSWNFVRVNRIIIY